MRRILFVSKYYASDFSLTVWGVYQRMRMLIEAAAASADALDILFFVDQGVIDKLGPTVSQESLRSHWGIAATVHLAPRAAKAGGRWSSTVSPIFGIRAQEEFYKTGSAAQVAALESCVRDDTDLVVCHRLDSGIVAAAADIRTIPIVMDLDDIEHVAFARRLRRPPHSIKKSVRFLELPALFAGEVATLRACHTSFICSEADRNYLSKRARGANIRVISNAIAFPDEATTRVASREARDTLLFIGTYGYEPNVEAAELLINDIFPLIRTRRPASRLLIVGFAVEKLPSFERAPAGVEFIGFVPDLADVYKRVAVVCCPIRTGGGTRIKIVEAAAWKKPVVSTAIGAEGLDFANESEIVLRDEPGEFAEACVALLENLKRAEEIGSAAHDRARTRYERSTVLATIVENYRAAGDASALRTNREANL